MLLAPRFGPTQTWRLNERHYGLLQGYNKDTAYADLGIDPLLLMRMRRTWGEPPPKMPDTHPYWHGGDRRYEGLGGEDLERSRGESLKMTAERVCKYYDEEVKVRERERERELSCRLRRR